MKSPSLVYIAATLVLLISCTSNKSDHVSDNKDSAANIVEHCIQLDTLYPKSKMTFRFNYDNTNYRSFGIQHFEHDLPIGPQDLLLLDSSILVLDKYHNNIKEVSFAGEIIRVSKPIANIPVRLIQFALLENRLLVLSNLDSIYFLDPNLQLIEKQFFPRGDNRIYSSTDEKIVIWSPLRDHRFIELDKSGRVLKEVIGINHKDDYISDEKYSEMGIQIADRLYIVKDFDIRGVIHKIDSDKIVYFRENKSNFELGLLTY